MSFDTRRDQNLAKMKQYSNSSVSIKLKIVNMLHELGIPSNFKGYSYIRDGIYLIYSDGGKEKSITKELYPYIATQYNTTVSRVERDIRNAIEVAYGRGNILLYDELFGSSIDYNKSRPTNNQFITTVAERVLIECSCV